MVVLLVLITIIAFLTVDYFVQRAALRRATVAATAAAPARVEAPVHRAVRAEPTPDQIPAGVYVGPGHAWLRPEDGGDVAVGADRLPLGLLGGVEHVRLEPAGKRVRRGEPVAILRRGFRTVAVPSPIDGLVTRTHLDAEEDPASVARDPFGDGWLVKLRPASLAARLHRMFVADEAVSWMRQELRRIRDALAEWSSEQPLAPALVTLPDGGLPADGLAQEMPAWMWEELCERFFSVREGSERGATVAVAGEAGPELSTRE